jgi:hypothetical protein
MGQQMDVKRAAWAARVACCRLLPTEKAADI